MKYCSECSGRARTADTANHHRKDILLLLLTLGLVTVPYLVYIVVVHHRLSQLACRLQNLTSPATMRNILVDAAYAVLYPDRGRQTTPLPRNMTEANEVVEIQINNPDEQSS